MVSPEQTNSYGAGNLDWNSVKKVSFQGEIGDEKPQGEVVARGEVSKLTRNDDGKLTLDSKYLSLYDSYKKDYAPQDKQDQALGKTIWFIGHSLALLDIDKDISSKIAVNDEINIDDLDPTSAKLYKKTWNSLLDMIDNEKHSQVLSIIEEMRKTGKTGEYFADMFEVLGESIANGEFTSENLRYRIEDSQPLNPDEVADESNYILKKLEQRYEAATSSSKIDPEEINDLFAKYSELLKNTFDAETEDIINQRLKDLSKLSDSLEGLQKKISSIDD